MVGAIEHVGPIEEGWAKERALQGYLAHKTPPSPPRTTIGP